MIVLHIKDMDFKEFEYSQLEEAMAEEFLSATVYYTEKNEEVATPIIEEVQKRVHARGLPFATSKLT